MRHLRFASDLLGQQSTTVVHNMASRSWISIGLGILQRHEQTPNRAICSGCEELERACVAYIHLASKLKKPQRRITVHLHDDFGKLMESARNGCHLCRCWAYALTGECLSPSSRLELYESTTPVIAFSPTASSSRLRSVISEARLAHFFGIKSTVKVDMRLGSVSDGEFKGLMHRSCDDSIHIAAEWLSECHGSHSSCLELGDHSALPTRLLDIHGVDTRLVDGSSLDQARYIALSYCWGGDQELKLIQATEATLKRGVNTTLLSRTIQDAIKLCRRLDIGYLWVDAFCILQDEGSKDWNTEAANIHRIYGNAYATLSICSAASASDGFLGLQWPDELAISPKRAKLVDMLPNPHRKSLASIRTKSPLAARGWIFQEELLSPRILYWSDQGSFWSCSTCKYAENGTTDVGGDELFPHIAEPKILDPHEFYRTDDPLLLWDDMITTFSIRDFTIDEDRLPAVSGLAFLIQQSTGEEYLMGLWRSRLPGQLLWVVTSPPRLTRPDAKRTSSASAGADRPLPPSWSWASISPTRKVVMPGQASSRAQFHRSSWLGPILRLHLTGQARKLSHGIVKLPIYPDKELAANTHLQIPAWRGRTNVWAVSEEQRKLIICLDWRRPIVIRLDNEVPRDLEALLCFEINYIGLLLLEPVSSTDGSTYRRLGCAQTHRESKFFEGASALDIVVV